MTSLPATIPIFPLFNVVLFPSVCLPLHIFEPRYREMVADALLGDRIIGMVLLRPGWEAEYEGRPAVYPVGCAGLITHGESLADGRYDIILRGLEKFRIVEEDDRRPYRLAQVEGIVETTARRDREDIRLERQRLEALLHASQDTRSRESVTPASMPDEELVNGLAQYLDLEPVERQALLEHDSLLARCRSMIELLEMKVLANHQPWNATGVH